MRNEITFRHSIVVSKPREVVWDFTQNYDKRTTWDSAVLETSVLQTEPNRIVKLRTKGRTTMIFVYKLNERPNKTSLAAREVTSSFVESGGGSWTYEDQGENTLWTQTNTIIFKRNL